MLLGEDPVIIETPRLRLRCWRTADQHAFAEMNADAEVALDLGGPMSRTASNTKLFTADYGLGAWHGLVWVAKHIPT
jgi:RimJ/RimL family protein N-acetyltransferase